MAWQNNTVELCGVTCGEPYLSHISKGVSYYGFEVLTRRLSGTADRVNVTVPQPLADRIPAPGGRISVRGELRSFNNRSGRGNRLLLYIYGQETEAAAEDGGEDINSVLLTGTLCKAPTWRRTPMGREICDLMLAVPRRYGRADYIPCIAWGRNAELAGSWEQGRRISVSGRFQSRKYIKLEDGVGMEKVAYEVSVTEFSEPNEAP